MNNVELKLTQTQSVYAVNLDERSYTVFYDEDANSDSTTITVYSVNDGDQLALDCEERKKVITVLNDWLYEQDLKNKDGVDFT